MYSHRESDSGGVAEDVNECEQNDMQQVHRGAFDVESSFPGWLAWLGLILAIVFGGQGAWFWMFRDQGPTRQVIEQAAEELRTQYQSSERIFLAPYFATQPREFLGDLSTYSVRSILSEDLYTTPKIWVVGMFGEGERLYQLMTRAGHLRDQHRVYAGGLTVDRFVLQSPRWRLVWDIHKILKKAVVTHEYGQVKAKCSKWQANNRLGPDVGKWLCPTDSSWFYVGSEWQRIDDTARYCLWAHPPKEGKLVITLPNVELGGHLVGRAGHTLMSRTRKSASIVFDVEVDGKVQNYEISSNEIWKPFRVKTSSKGQGTIKFSISTSHNGANHFCFVAQMHKEIR